MQRQKVILLGSLVIALAIWGLGPFTGINAYISSVKAGKLNPAFEQGGQALRSLGFRTKADEASDAVLLERIRKEAESKRIAPIDAKVDRVWKAVPGYNGLEVDVDKTFQLARKQESGSAIPFVYREVPPQIGLSDLGAQPVYKGNPKKPMVSLMINVAWGDEFLPSMLDTLKKENVRATFFFDGSWLSKHVETAQLIGSYGHELSNHAYSHKNMSQLSDAKAEEEIVKTQKLLEEKLGVHNTLFAPPSGDFDQQTVNIASRLGLQTVLWTLDTVDWKNPPADSVIRKINSRLEPGALILMHPTKASSEALPAIIQEIKRRGMALGTVSETLSSNRVASADAAAQWEAFPEGKLLN